MPSAEIIYSLILFLKFKCYGLRRESQKETSPLAHFVRNSLPHKSFHFCSPMLEEWCQLNDAKR